VTQDRSQARIVFLKGSRPPNFLVDEVYRSIVRNGVMIDIVIAAGDHYAPALTAELFPDAFDPVSSKSVFFGLTSKGNVTGDDQTVHTRQTGPKTAEIKLQFVSEVSVLVVHVVDPCSSEMKVRDVDEDQVGVSDSRSHFRVVHYSIT
jgi:hypothetical protein